MEDLETFFRREEEKELVEGFKNNTLRYTKIFEILADKMIPPRNIGPSDDSRHRFENIINEQRRDNFDGENPRAENELIPRQTYKNYDVAIIYGPGSKSRL